jgi:hypothetical protein
LNSGFCTSALPREPCLHPACFMLIYALWFCIKEALKELKFSISLASYNIFQASRLKSPSKFVCFVLQM